MSKNKDNHNKLRFIQPDGDITVSNIDSESSPLGSVLISDGVGGSTWGSSVFDKYASFTDGITTTIANGSDVFKIRAGSDKISVVVQDNNITHGDNLSIDVNQENLSLSKSQVGLGNVDNTSDANKPISSATQTALDLKSATSHTHADATTSVSGFLSATDKIKLNATSGTNTGDQTSVSGNAGSATVLQTARNIDGQSFNGSADITVIAPGTHAATSKSTPVDADEIPLVDSAASNILKKLSWANLKATVLAAIPWASPGAIGATTPNTGAFTSLTVAGAGNVPGYKNLVINGSCRVAQRGNVSLSTPNSFTRGGCDGWLAISTHSTVSGTLQQCTTAGTGTASGYCQQLASCTTTGSGSIYFATRLESKQVAHLNGKTVTISAKFYHDVGSPLSSHIAICKANAQDNFSGSTQIGVQQDGSGDLPSSTWVTVYRTLTLGTSDASNGLYLEFGFLAVNAVTAKNFYFGNIQLVEGSAASAFEMPPYEVELAQCQRYYETGYFQLSGGHYDGAYSRAVGTIQFKTTKRAVPTVTFSSALLYQASNGTNDVANWNTGDNTIGTDSIVTNWSRLGAMAMPLRWVSSWTAIAEL